MRIAAGLSEKIACSKTTAEDQDVFQVSLLVEDFVDKELSK